MRPAEPQGNMDHERGRRKHYVPLDKLGFRVGQEMIVELLLIFPLQVSLVCLYCTTCKIGMIIDHEQSMRSSLAIYPQL